jgi:hypothetical protein
MDFGKKYVLIFLLLIGLGLILYQSWRIIHSPEAHLHPALAQPARVRVDCPLNDCPEGIGIIILGGNQATEGLDACTATLIDHEHILTASHCVVRAALKSFFFYRRGSQTEFRQVMTVAFRATSPKPLDGVFFVYDYVILTLSHPIENIQLHPVSRAIRARLQRMVTVTTVENPRPWTFSLVKHFCQVIPESDKLMATIPEGQTLVAVGDCSIQKGDSGAPLFLEGKPEVQAVLNALVDTNSINSQTFQEMAAANPIFAKIKEPFTIANRLYCADIPGLLSPARPCP